MHELFLGRSVVETVEQRATREGFSRVLRVGVRLGALSHVDTEALRLSFDVAAQGTVADGARLDIVRGAGEAYCFDCAETVEVANRTAPCPRCGSGQLLITDSAEMQLTEMEGE
jgi:hydrogenase nickel incorporation protein HypA/HybF